MPYLVLAIGLLIGLYALYRFFLNADVRQIKALFLVTSIVVLAVALFFMALTGRLPAALALFVAILPFASSLWKMNKEGPLGGTPPKTGPMTRKDALEVLGLEEGVSAEEIKEAYKKLMQKVHPDNEGSDWMAAKLNEARDLLLDQEN